MSSDYSTVSARSEEIAEVPTSTRSWQITTIGGPEALASEPAVLSIQEAIAQVTPSSSRPRAVRRLLNDRELGRFFSGCVGEVHRSYVITLLGEALGGSWP